MLHHDHVRPRPIALSSRQRSTDITSSRCRKKRTLSAAARKKSAAALSGGDGSGRLDPIRAAAISLSNMFDPL